MILSIGGSITLSLLVIGVMGALNDPEPTKNPYILTTCIGHEISFNSTNSNMAGVVQCNNGTLIKIHYMQITNDTVLYSGFKLTT